MVFFIYLWSVDVEAVQIAMSCFRLLCEEAEIRCGADELTVTQLLPNYHVYMELAAASTALTTGNNKPSVGSRLILLPFSLMARVFMCLVSRTSCASEENNDASAKSGIFHSREQASVGRHLHELGRCDTVNDSNVFFSNFFLLACFRELCPVFEYFIIVNFGSFSRFLENYPKTKPEEGLITETIHRTVAKRRTSHQSTEHALEVCLYYDVTMTSFFERFVSLF